MTYRYDLERLRAACEEVDLAADAFEQHALTDDLALEITNLRTDIQHFIYATEDGTCDTQE